MRKIVSLVAAVLVTTAALGFSLRGIDFDQLVRLLSKGNYLFLLPFEFFLFLFFLFTAFRWALILRPLGTFTVWKVTPAMMIGFGGNNLLPAHLGELVRLVVFARRFEKTKSGVLGTLMVERALDLLAILFFYFAAALFIRPFPESIRVGSLAVAIFAVMIFAAFFLFLRYPAVAKKLWRRLMFFLPGRLQDRGALMIDNMIAGFSSLSSIRLLGWVVLHSLLKWASAGAMVWLSLGVYGGEISFGVGMIVIAVTSLVGTLPSAPGYVGVIQAGFVLALLPFGISQEIALAASIFYLMAQWIPVTVVGLFFLITFSLSLRQIRQEVAEFRTAAEPAREK